MIKKDKRSLILLLVNFITFGCIITGSVLAGKIIDKTEESGRDLNNAIETQWRNDIQRILRLTEKNLSETVKRKELNLENNNDVKRWFSNYLYNMVDDLDTIKNIAIYEVSGNNELKSILNTAHDRESIEKLDRIVSQEIMILNNSNTVITENDNTNWIEWINLPNNKLGFSNQNLDTTKFVMVITINTTGIMKPYQEVISNIASMKIIVYGLLIVLLITGISTISIKFYKLIENRDGGERYDVECSRYNNNCFYLLVNKLFSKP